MINKNNNRAIIFVHYDKHNIVDDYVYFYLQELQRNSLYLVFVSTAKLSEKDVTTLSKYCSKVIVRENIGYDFMSYKIGLESFDYTSYDEVVICNDSVYGPLMPLENIFKEMQNVPCDFWGITDNTDMGYHLQSYFVVFRKNVLKSSTFKTFWNEAKVLHNKDDIIEKYEVGMSRALIDNGFVSSTYTAFKATAFQKISAILKRITLQKIYLKVLSIVTQNYNPTKIGKLNPTHHFWKDLLLSSKMPFIKIELLRDNPLDINITDVENTLSQISDYDISLVNNHLNRMKEDRCTE